MPNRAENLLSYVWWPLLMAICCGVTALGMARDAGVLYFNGAYLFLACSLFFLERRFPHERAWLENCGQMLPDLAHTLLSKGTVQVLLVAGGAMGLAGALKPEAGPFWPGAWPLGAQVMLGLLLAEAGLYWAHRVAHQWRPLWRFHAVHHASSRLWFWNTGRFHFVDTLASIALSQPLLWLAGAPTPIFLWVGAITAFIGMLTHCNVAMRFGPISILFNTPELHRWHHSKVPIEGNSNYGENLMLFDQLFGTYFRARRRPPATIGIDEPMAAAFLGQLAQPFRPER
jgi:sterol desaturase/sphingolipid hydroxylase (fatty acid hydroxylase superfamily)